MKVILLKPKNFSEVVREAARALRAGKIVVYPTDTSYALGAVATNKRAIAKIYKIKEREFKKPVHVMVSSLNAAKKLVRWTPLAEKKFRKHLPGALTPVLELKSKNKDLFRLTAETGYLGIRIPKHRFGLALAKAVGAPITATSANPSARLSGGFDPYSVKDIESQFRNKKFKPDLIVDAGILKKNKPSTVAKLENGVLTVLRQGPVVLNKSK